MARQITIDGTDRLGVIKQGWRLAQQAHRGEATESGFDLDDDAGSLSFPTYKIVRLLEDASGATKHLYRGRILTKGLGRGEHYLPAARRFGNSLTDSNWDLRKLRVHQWVRPSETGRARVVALGAYILNGSSSTVTNARKRPSTVIDVTTYVPDTNTVTMPARTYDSTDPYAVVDDCARAEGKEFFIIIDDATGAMYLWFDTPTSTSYASTLSITDSSPDHVTSFPPGFDGQPGTLDGTELLSGAALVASDGLAYAESRVGIETAFDVAEEMIYDSGAGAVDAAARLTSFLNERDDEEPRYRCAITLPPEKAHLIKHGMTLSFRWAAAGVTSPLTLRVARCELENSSPGMYVLHLELGFPEKIAPRIQSHGQGTIVMGTLIGRDAAPAAMSATVTVDYYQTNTPDTGNWSPTAANQRPFSGVDYGTYDYDADAQCGAAVQLRDPLQRFGGALITFTGFSGEPVRVSCSIYYDSEQPPLGPRPDAKKWMPHWVTVQPRTVAGAPPVTNKYSGALVMTLDRAGHAPGTVDNVFLPIYGSGATRRLFIVWIPQWELESKAICDPGGFPADWGACQVGVESIVLQGIGGAGWYELSPLGTFDGQTTAFTLAGDVTEVEYVKKNGLDITDYSVDLGTNTITFVTPPRATDTVIVRYRVQ